MSELQWITFSINQSEKKLQDLFQQVFYHNPKFQQRIIILIVIKLNWILILIVLGSPLSRPKISAINRYYFRNKVAKTKLSGFLNDIVHDLNAFAW